jgi:hypothetical protein
VGDQDIGSPGRPVSPGLQVPGDPFPSWSGYGLISTPVSPTCFGTAVPSSGSLSDESIQAQRANQGTHRSHWNY